MEHKEQVRKDFFDVLYKKTTASLLRFGLRFTKDIALVEDCIHESYEELIKIEDIKKIRDSKAYLLRLFRNKLINRLRATTPTECIDEVNYTYQWERSPEDKMIEEETRQEIEKDVEEALKCLTCRQKEIIILRFWGNCSHNEICQKLGINSQTLYNNIHDALLRMKQKLGSLPPDVSQV